MTQPSEMNDGLGLEPSDGLGKQTRIEKIDIEKLDPRQRRSVPKIGPGDIVALRRQVSRESIPDEARDSGDENAHGCQANAGSAILPSRCRQ